MHCATEQITGHLIDHSDLLQRPYIFNIVFLYTDTDRMKCQNFKKPSHPFFYFSALR